MGLTTSYASRQVAEAIRFARVHGADVINFSGTTPRSCELNTEIAVAPQDAVVVVSAGNAVLTALSFYRDVLVVTALDSPPNDCYLESRSAAHWRRVDIAAPGRCLRSMDVTDRTGSCDDTCYSDFEDTSAAATLVSSTAALVRSTYPQLTASETRRAVLDGARRVPELVGCVVEGRVVDAEGALRVARQLAGNQAPRPAHGPPPLCKDYPDRHRR